MLSSPQTDFFDFTLSWKHTAAEQQSLTNQPGQREVDVLGS